MTDQIDWLLNSKEPWTQYRTMVDLLGFPVESKEVLAVRRKMLTHPQISMLIENARDWPGYPLKRHNDAKHPLYAISTLADFGLNQSDSFINEIIEHVLEQISVEGMLEAPILIPEAFGGSGEESWTWMLCDSPTLLYSLLAFDWGEGQNLQKAVNHITSLVQENGWRCTVSPELGKFKGPGRRADPCPIANVYALKALSLSLEGHEAAARAGTEMLLKHWQLRREKKYYLFGMGTDFAKLKYPFVWYDILHVVDVLSRFPWVYSDPRMIEMVTTITDQVGAHGRYTPGSMYMAWRGWSFADKKNASPWITFLVLRIQNRMGMNHPRI